MPKQATRRRKVAPAPRFIITERVLSRLREAAMLGLAAVSVLIFLALASFEGSDPGWSHTHSASEINNWIGPTGAYLADAFLYLFGYFAYLFPVLLLEQGWLLVRHEKDAPFIKDSLWVLRFLGFILALTSGTALATLHVEGGTSSLLMGPGGLLGQAISTVTVQYFSMVGTSVLLFSLFFIGMTLSTGFSWLWFIDQIGKSLIFGFEKLKAKLKNVSLSREMVLVPEVSDEPEAVAAPKRKRKAPVEVEDLADEHNGPIIIPNPEPIIGLSRQESFFTKKEVKAEKNIPRKILEGFPSFDLLAPGEPPKNGYSEEKLKELSHLVEQKLLDFGIEVEVVSISPGPVITRLEMQLAPGIKVSRLTGLAKDIARSLSVVSVRVVEVIPGKTYVGLEIPNVQREMVRLRELLESSAYHEQKSPLSLALGKDISGKPVVVDLARMPHLLIAGTTGSGKSVGVNAMLLSLLYKGSPEEVKLILIDPKMLELSIYEGIPHLLTPVITDMKDAAHALKWCVSEMDRRYRLMAALGVRNVAGYNQKIKEATEKGTPIVDPLYVRISDEPVPLLTTLPFVVVIIDEFADMIMVVGKKVEELITRIAQKARAAGIHLLLATQRPSVDVITGLIKANIPTRIAFQVSSRIDSRTILDQQGAEQLLGHGDMLYLPPGSGIPARVHGAFVSDEEVHNVVDDWKKRGQPEYIDTLQDYSSSDDEYGDEGDGDDNDELYDKSVYIVTESRRASISHLQRRLKIGYNRAARLIEQMEKQGIVSSLQSGGNREVIAPPPVGIREK